MAELKNEISYHRAQLGVQSCVLTQAARTAARKGERYIKPIDAPLLHYGPKDCREICRRKKLPRHIPEGSYTVWPNRTGCTLLNRQNEAYRILLYIAEVSLYSSDPVDSIRRVRSDARRCLINTPDSMWKTVEFRHLMRVTTGVLRKHRALTSAGPSSKEPGLS